MLRLTNFASSAVVSPISVGDSSVTVLSVAGFPALSAGDFFYAVFQDVSDKRRQEVVKVVGITGSVVSVERTHPLSFPAGSFLELRLTSEALFALMADGAAYHHHAQEAVESDIVFSYSNGLVSSVASVVLGLPKTVTFSYINGRVDKSVEVYAGRKRTSSYLYSGDDVASITVVEEPV